MGLHHLAPEGSTRRWHAALEAVMGSVPGAASHRCAEGLGATLVGRSDARSASLREDLVAGVSSSTRPTASIRSEKAPSALQDAVHGE